MNEVMQALINYMLAFGGVIALMFFFLNFMTKGFLFQYLRVKASQGRFILSRIHSATDTYYKVCKFDDGFLKVKVRSKEKLSIPVAEAEMASYFNKELGITVVELDEVGKKLLNFDFKGVSQFDNYDAGRVESLLLKIKNRPVLNSKREQIILIAVILIAIVLFFVAFRVIKIEESIQALGLLSGNI